MLWSAVVFTSIFFYIFAVIGVNLLSGRMVGCYSPEGLLLDPYYLTNPDQNINRTWCVRVCKVPNHST